MQNPLGAIHEYLDSGRQVVLARIIHQVGSAPRALGTECLFLDDGGLIGSIGGGSLEYRVAQMIPEIIDKGVTHTLNFDLTGTEVAKTEMLCGGIVDVYLEPVLPDNRPAADLFKRIHRLLAAGAQATLLTVIQDGRHQADQIDRLLIETDGTMTGTIEAISPEMGQQLASTYGQTAPRLLAAEADHPSLFIEVIKPYDTVYLFGAGHISTFVAPLAARVGFKVIVLDDRQEFASRERFPEADDILVCPLTDVFREHIPTSSAYMVIVTRGHIHDLGILRQALGQEHAYIGMIGSRRKRDMIYQALRKEGVTQEALDQVHSPIGLAIGAQTPEEIAVSIVAELIQVRSERTGRMV